MGCLNGLVALLLFAMASSVLAYDPSLLQDFCVPDPDSPVFVNGLPCKNPNLVNNKDFIFRAKFNEPGNTATAVGSVVTPAFVTQFPALNTMGVAMGRIDFAPNGGLNALHEHPRASEIFLCMQGTLLTGFVTTNPNRLFTNVLHPGDLAVFPQGLVHFQLNLGHGPAVAFAAFNSQLPGIFTIASAAFNSTPPFPEAVLERSFGVGPEVIDKLRAQFRSLGVDPEAIDKLRAQFDA